MRLAAIWAQDRRRVLGSGTGMLWHVPADFAHFRRTTLGAPVLMGRASWEALDGPLPGRPNIVVTRRPGYRAPGARVAESLDRAVELGAALAREIGADTVWVTGGASLYAQALERVDELVVTDLDLDVQAAGDPGPFVRAPRVDPACWARDPERSDADWRPRSGDARWRVTVWVRSPAP